MQQIWTSNFRKVVWQHILGVMDDVIHNFVRYLTGFPAVKEFWKSVNISQNYGHKMAHFLKTQCIYTINHTTINSHTFDSSLTFCWPISESHLVSYKTVKTDWCRNHSFITFATSQKHAVRYRFFVQLFYSWKSWLKHEKLC